MHRIKAKHMPIVLTVLMILLFLLSLTIATITRAQEVMDSMIPEIEGQFQEKITEFKTTLDLIDDGEFSDSTKLAKLQLVMADYTDSTSLTYPIRCYSMVSDRNGGGYCNSRNAVILSRMADGVEESIPLIFLENDTADIPQVLTYPFPPDKSPLVLKEQYLEAEYAAHNNHLTFHISDLGTGIGYDYYIASVTEKSSSRTASYDTLYRMYENYPESTDITTYTAKANYGDTLTENWSFITCVKSFGGEKFFDSNYTRGWWKTDQLNQVLVQEICQYTNELISSPGLFKTRVCGVKTYFDSPDLMRNTDEISFSYVAEFSPFTIALGIVFRTGLVLQLLILFIAAWVLLMTLYTSTRKEELSALRDEIARQEKALSFAKDAEENRREMTSAIAHELKTPIAVLSSYAEAASDQIDPEKQQYYLSVILQQSRKMDQMVLELLDLSRLEAGKYKLRRENFDMKELTEDIIAPLMQEIEEKQISLTWQVTDPTVNADRYRMGQIVENFMTNAIRHTPEGGRIILRIGTSTETFSVENQGSAIPRDQLKKVWETFYQGDASRNSRGSGLGLSICRSIIALHGGSCKAENTALGVKFSVSLSAANAPYLTSIVHHEEVIELNYQIAQEYTTVENLMRNLGLLKRQDLPGEVKAGNLKVGQETITSPKQKLYPGYVLSWQEFKIRIILKDEDKRQAMLMEMLKGERGLGSPYRSIGGACGGK